MSRKLLTNIGWIGTPQSPNSGDNPYTLQFLDADSILIEDEFISKIGESSDFIETEVDEKIDLGGWGVTPGLIDFHTHPVFAGTREEEFELRTEGVTYEEIARAGGGIVSTVLQVRQASEEQLVGHTLPYLDSALAHGTTTMEAKSGYGLSPEAEYKMLRVIRHLHESHPVDLVPTFLGAHTYLPTYKSDHEAYLEILTEEMIPHVARERLAEACDIFIERGAFSSKEARKILEAALENGLKIKAHSEQLSHVGGTKLATGLGALSADHLEYIDSKDIHLLAEGDTVAGLLPVAAHFLRMEKDPPVREMIDQGVICALGTDFNPGSAMCENMQMALHLAAIRFRITASEALWMATSGSASALGLKDRGWIGEGALADLVVWKTDRVTDLVYHFGVNHAWKVFKRGSLVFDNPEIRIVPQ